MDAPEPLFTTQEFAALSAAGFRSLGPVSSRTVVFLDYLDREAQCSSRQRRSQQTDLAAAIRGSFNAMLRQRHRAREEALARLVTQCRERGGHGVVGLKLSVSPFTNGRTAFVLRGVAIRIRAGFRPADPFTTHFSGQALASLLRAGWIPVSLVFGISLGSRHDDLDGVKHPVGFADTRRELRSYSQLVRDTRRDARTRLGHVISDLGADGVLVDKVTVEISERECPKVLGARDRMAEAVILGTAIVSVQTAGSAPAPLTAGGAPLTIMRLNPSAPISPGLRPRFL